MAEATRHRLPSQLAEIAFGDFSERAWGCTGARAKGATFAREQRAGCGL
jgi:hypothetical protein